MSELTQLYKEIILGHNKQPRNRGCLPDATHQAEVNNPLCGDEVHLYLRVVDGVVEAARFEGEGCAISRASASMMTEFLQGRSVEEGHERMKRLSEGLLENRSMEVGELGDFAALSGVSRYPSRIKCALLAWEAFEQALKS